MALFLDTDRDNYLVKVTDEVLEIESSWVRATPTGHEFQVAQNLKLWDWGDKSINEIGISFKKRFHDELTNKQLRDLELIILEN